MRIATGIDAEFAAPASAAEFIQRFFPWYELLTSPDAAHTIGADLVDSETPQELPCFPQVRGVLRKEDDARGKPDSASDQLAYPLDRPFEAAFLTRNPVVDGWIERVEREMDPDSQGFECLNEIFADERSVGEDFATLETHARRVLEKPFQIWMDRGLTTYELQPATAYGSRFTHQAAPIKKRHPLGER